MTFSNFSEKAREAIRNSHDVACELGHGYIGSEHLLLGIMKTEGAQGAKLLEDRGVTYERALERIRAMIGSGEGVTVMIRSAVSAKASEKISSSDRLMSS